MTLYTHGPVIAWDSAGQQLIKNAIGNVYAPTDPGFATPLTVTNLFGVSITDLISDSDGVIPPFQSTLPRVVWKAAGDDRSVSLISMDLIDAAVNSVPDNGGRAVGKGELVINVTDPAYGAVGDGTTDDKTAINTAIAAAATAGTPITVRLKPNAVHAISGSINSASNVHIDGNGATLKWTASTGDRPLLLANVSNVQVSDLTVDMGTTPPSQSAVFSNGSDHVEFRRVKVTTTGVTDTGFRLSGCTNSTIDDCDVTGSANAYNITGASAKCKIINSRATGTLAGVLINPSGSSAPSDIDVSDVTVMNFPTSGVISYPIRSAGTSSAHNKRVRFTDCTVIGPNQSFASGLGTADQINMVYTDGVTVEGCTSMYGGDMGISFSNCNYLTVVGNLSMYNDTGGIVISTACTFATVTGNTCVNNGQNRGGSHASANAMFGVGTGGGSYVTIVGNTIGDDQGTHTQNYGVRLAFSGDVITVGPNTYHGSVINNFYTDGTPTNINNIDAGGGSDVFGKRAAYASVTSSASSTISTINTWTAFTGAPTITLPNDGGTYRLDLHGTDATMSTAGSLSLALSGDGGSTWIKQSTHVHTGTTGQDRVHLTTGNVTGTGQSITVWAFASVTGTMTMVASGSSPLELWATRIN